MMEEKMLRVIHAAKRLDVSDRTIYRWISEGIVFRSSAIIRMNRTIRILESEVERIRNAGDEG